MSNKPNSQKIKIIQFKDVISIFLIVVLLSVTFSGVFAATNFFTQLLNFFKSNKNTSSTVTRELAMFSAIACVDLERINGYSINNTKPNASLSFKEKAMITDAQLKKIKVNSSLLLGTDYSNNSNAYTSLFNTLASTSEVSDWKIINYSKYNVDNLEFVAMTFKKSNNIAIAYRGVSIEKILNDKFINLNNQAKEYASKVVAKYPNANIYITGYGFGGYFAQLGGAQLLSNSTYKNNIKEISYFNSVGLKFQKDINNILNDFKNDLSNSKSELKSILSVKILGVSVGYNQIAPILKENLKSFKVPISNDDYDFNILKNWKKQGGMLISHKITDSLLSDLGSHAGYKNTYKQQPLSKVDSKIKIIDLIGTKIDLNEVVLQISKIKITYKDVISKIASTNNIIKLISLYIDSDFNEDETTITDIIGYLMSSYKIDNFWTVLPYENGLSSPSISISFSNEPDKLKNNKTATIYLTITTKNGSLKSQVLTTKDFTVSKPNRLKVISVSYPTVSTTNNITKYKYSLNIQGSWGLGKANIMFSKQLSITPLLPGYNNKDHSEILNKFAFAQQYTETSRYIK